MRESRNDGGGVIDFVGHAAHELSHRRELLGLLQLRLRAALLRDVAHEDEDLGDAAAFAHRREQHLAGTFAAVGPLKRDLETAQLAIERRGQILARDTGPRSLEPRQRRAPAAALSGVAGNGVDEDTARRVFVEHPAVAVYHGDGVGDRFHEQAEIALRGRRRAERAHQRSGLIGDLVLEDPLVPPIDAEGVEHTGGHDRHPDAEDDRNVGFGSGAHEGDHRHAGHAGEADRQGHHPRYGAGTGRWRAAPQEMVGVIRCDGRRGRDE